MQDTKRCKDAARKPPLRPRINSSNINKIKGNITSMSYIYNIALKIAKWYNPKLEDLFRGPPGLRDKMLAPSSQTTPLALPNTVSESQTPLASATPQACGSTLTTGMIIGVAFGVSLGWLLFTLALIRYLQYRRYRLPPPSSIKREAKPGKPPKPTKPSVVPVDIESAGGHMHANIVPRYERHDRVRASTETRPNSWEKGDDSPKEPVVMEATLFGSGPLSIDAPLWLAPRGTESF